MIVNQGNIETTDTMDFFSMQRGDKKFKNIGTWRNTSGRPLPVVFSDKDNETNETVMHVETVQPGGALRLLGYVDDGNKCCWVITAPTGPEVKA